MRLERVVLFMHKPTTYNFVSGTNVHEARMTLDDKARWYGRVTFKASCALTIVCMGIQSACHQPERDVRGDIQSRDVGERIGAIKRAAVEGDVSALPQLVDRLDDEDAAVRFAAIIALESLTGQRRGYRYGRPSAAAIAEWRRAMEQGHDASESAKEWRAGVGSMR